MARTSTTTRPAPATSTPPPASAPPSDGLADPLSDSLGSGGGPSSTRLKAERAALYAKKYGARALDVAMFAPLHLIDQASILDVHAVDAANFLASGKTRAQRDKEDIDDRFDYTPSYTGGLMNSEKGRRKVREMGRTQLRPMVNDGSHIGSAISTLGEKKGVKGFLGKKKWGWGEGVLGVNPIQELHRASMPEESSPETKDNKRLAEIREQLHEKKELKQARRAAKKGGGGAT